MITSTIYEDFVKRNGFGEVAEIAFLKTLALFFYVLAYVPSGSRQVKEMPSLGRWNATVTRRFLVHSKSDPMFPSFQYSIVFVVKYDWILFIALNLRIIYIYIHICLYEYIDSVFRFEEGKDFSRAKTRRMGEGLSFMRIVCQVIDCWCAVTIPPWPWKCSLIADIVIMRRCQGPWSWRSWGQWLCRQFHRMLRFLVWNLRYFLRIDFGWSFCCISFFIGFARCRRQRSERWRKVASRRRFWANGANVSSPCPTSPSQFQGSWRWRTASLGSSKVGPNDTNPTSPWKAQVVRSSGRFETWGEPSQLYEWFVYEVG